MAEHALTIPYFSGHGRLEYTLGVIAISPLAA